MKNQGLDLTKVSPTSPSRRVGGYVILARLADKARAEFCGGNIGDYHTNCPLDHYLLDWKGVDYSDLKKEIVGGADNESLARYLDTHGQTKSPDEVRDWSDKMEKLNLYDDPEKRDWYAEQTSKLGLDPKTTPMFRWLDIDDKISHDSTKAA